MKLDRVSVSNNASKVSLSHAFQRKASNVAVSRNSNNASTLIPPSKREIRTGGFSNLGSQIVNN